MKGDALYEVTDFILNQATERDLDVVQAALKRRVEGNKLHGAMGLDPGRMARETAASIREQMGLSMDQIRTMVRDFAAEIIEKNAPELGAEKIHELLDTWVPTSPERRGAGLAERAPEGDPAAARSSGRGAGGGERPAKRGAGAKGKPRALPPDAILTMVMQFLSYSTESMSVSQQMRLNEEIPDWQRRYWAQFSPRIRELLTLFLRGEIDHETCVARVYGELGIEAK